ncbi:hypothetical protein ADL06_28075 [Streptomyces sp. NRRL F-6491]|nr:hypothetical protein ADL06_28075 [Streptomyces sp. NRRL F-6491]KOX41592.1 hypothetical protein ADL08_18360 [Streptomyces sp. NRRL F-6492]
MRVGVDGLQGDLRVPERRAGQLLQEPEDVRVLQVAVEERGPDVHRQVGRVQGERQSVQAPQPLDAQHVGVLGQPEPVGHRAGRPDRPHGPHLVGDPPVLVRGLGEPLEPVRAVRVLLADHHRADPRLPVDQLLAAQQVQCLPHGVPAGPVVGRDDVLQGEDPAGETARQDLVAQQVGELPRPVRPEAPTAGGGDGAGGGGGFGGHDTERSGGPATVVLPRYCAT